MLEFLAHKITSNVRELEGALNRLIAHANLFGRSVTLESTQDVLHDILKAHDRRVTIEEIQRKVSEHWNIRLTDMSSARRARAVARPRQVAMYLPSSLPAALFPRSGASSAIVTIRQSCMLFRACRSSWSVTSRLPRMSSFCAACSRADLFAATCGSAKVIFCFSGVRGSTII